MFAKRYLNNAYLFVFCAILLSGFMASINLYQEEKKRISYERHVAAKNIKTFIENKLLSLATEVNGLSAFFETAPNAIVNYKQFLSYSQSLVERQDGLILNVYFAEQVQDSNKATYLEKLRQVNKNPNLKIIPDGQRDQYLPLTYSAPDVILYGTDLLAPDLPYSPSVLRAIESQTVIMTPPTVLAMDRFKGSQRKDAIILRKAIFEEEAFSAEHILRGIVGVVFRVDTILRDINVNNPKLNLSYRLADLTDQNLNQEIEWFFSKESHPNSFHHPNYELEKFTVEFGGRTWLIESCIQNNFLNLYNWKLLLIQMVFYVLLAFLLSWFVYRLSTAYGTMLKKAQETLAVDELTQLHSRFEIRRLLNENIIHAQNSNGFSILLLDLDHFKTINDVFGHETGDLLLVRVAQRLKACFPSEAMIGRTGGDEFLIILPIADHETTEQLGFIARDCIQQLSKSYYVEGRMLSIGCSVGLTQFYDDSESVSALIKNAEMAMYEAKKSGRSGYYFYDKTIGDRLSRNVLIETRLRVALDEKSLELYFQPKVDLLSQKCIGLEALLRWNDAELGDISPVEFIPVAESCGLIIPLGEWVFDQSCSHIKQWHDAGEVVPTVAINCSAAQLKRDDFLSGLISCLDKYNVQPDKIELEVTESILIEDLDSCAELLKQVSHLGMNIAIDDFGTGYSGLSYLKDLPFNSIKIDQVFVRDMLINENHLALTKAIIQMSHALNLKVVAEGITSTAQMDKLIEFGCDIGQGYLFGKAFHADLVVSKIDS